MTDIDATVVVVVYLLAFVLIMYLLITWFRREHRKEKLHNGTSDESGIVDYEHYYRQAGAVGPQRCQDDFVVVVDTEHLADAVQRINSLMERAVQGDRAAEKELLFAERYGYDPIKTEAMRSDVCMCFEDEVNPLCKFHGDLPSQLDPRKES